MPKRAKIILYIILLLAIITVVGLMSRDRDIDVELDTDIGSLTGEYMEDFSDSINIETPTFEEDVMNDLEGFFRTNNGYEDIEGEFGFTNLENE